MAEARNKDAQTGGGRQRGVRGLGPVMESVLIQQAHFNYALKDKHVFVLLGGVGQGKTSLTAALTSPEYDYSDQLKVAVDKNGVTKEVHVIQVDPNILEDAVILDTPGVGDKDTGVGEVIGRLEGVLEGTPVNGVIICASTTEDRLQMGTQFAGMLMEKGFIDAWDQFIICGTKMDRAEDDESNDIWREEIGGGLNDDNFQSKAKVVLTSVGMERDPNDRKSFNINRNSSKHNIHELVAVMTSLAVEGMKRCVYDAPESKALLEGAAKILKLETSPKELNSMSQELDAIRAQLTETRRLLKEKENESGLGWFLGKTGDVVSVFVVGEEVLCQRKLKGDYKTGYVTGVNPLKVKVSGDWFSSQYNNDWFSWQCTDVIKKERAHDAGSVVDEQTIDSNNKGHSAASIVFKPVTAPFTYLYSLLPKKV